MEAGIIILWILAVILVAAGVAGLVLPMIPGPPMIFAGLVMAAWAEGFAHVGGVILFILAVLALIAVTVDFLAGALGARRFGASRKAVIGAAAGAFFGLFFGIPGIIAGPFIGAVAGELTVRRNYRAIGMAGIGAWLGLVMGAAAKVAIGFTMIGVFLLARFL